MTFLAIGVGPDHVIKGIKKRTLGAEMGCGWEWTGEIGEKKCKFWSSNSFLKNPKTLALLSLSAVACGGTDVGSRQTYLLLSTRTRK